MEYNRSPHNRYTKVGDMPFEPQWIPSPDPWSLWVDRIRSVKPSYDELLEFYVVNSEDAFLVGLHQKSTNYRAFASNVYDRSNEILRKYFSPFHFTSEQNNLPNKEAI